MGSDAVCLLFFQLYSKTITNFAKQFFQSFTTDVPKLKLMNDVKFKIKSKQEIEMNVIHVRTAECVYMCVTVLRGDAQLFV